MADILIRGMEMPKSCLECKIKSWDEDGDYICPFSEVVCLNIGRQYDCPLIEVIDHGDLIDRDEIIIPFLESENDEKWVKVAIDATPTIIPASRKE